MKRLQPENIFIIFLFLFALGHSFSTNAVGIDFPILDRHNFRQTQTAITALFLGNGGAFFAYETPVLGAPWSIPFEFPLYQQIAASFSKFFSTDLDFSGRVVALIFYYLSLVPFYGICRLLGLNKTTSLIPVTLILSSSIYLYWSRTFMIESTGLFFGASYLFNVMIDVKNPTRTTAAFSLIFGCLAVLVKATTFVGFLYFAGIYCFVHLIQLYKVHSKFPLNFTLRSTIIFAAIPLIVGFAWVNFGDLQKIQNPFSNNFITREALADWNFGTWSQRTSPQTWSTLYGFEVQNVINHLGPFFLLLALIPKTRYWSLAFLLTFIAVPLTFFNLHSVHDYYVYSNGVFLLLAIGLGLGKLVQQSHRKGIILAGIYILLAGSINRYYENQFPSQKHKENIPEISTALELQTSENEVIIIWGEDWSAKIPYYAQRRALMDRWDSPLDSPRFVAALENLQQYKIGALVFCNRPQEFIEKRLAHFGFAPASRVLKQHCAAYFKTSEPPI